MRILVVGAGLAGSTAARSLAEAGHHVSVIDARSHVAGNAHDHVNEHGIRVHTYGAHIFHTSNDRAWEWLSRFTEWLPYQHKIKAQLADGTLVPFPINDETLAHVPADRVIDVFFRPYTEKMWGVPMDSIDDTVLDRVRSRSNPEGLYFPHDRHQALPKDGYESMMQRMLYHPRIRVTLGTKFDRAMEADHDHVFNCMPIDEYFDHHLGELPYRSIKFTHVHLPMAQAFPASVINFTHRGPQTRVIEWKHMPGHGTNDSMTTITYETPCDYRDNGMERYYPVKDTDGRNRELYKRYAALVPPKMTFIGRCGQYVYIDMDQAVSSSLATAERFISQNS